MTRSAILAVLICCGAGAMAQNEKGRFSVRPMVGVNVSTFSGGVSDDFYHTKVRPTGGFELEYGATKWLGISLGAIYSQQGAKSDGELRREVTRDEANYYTAPMTLSEAGYGVMAKVDGHVYGDYLNFPLLANIYIPQMRGLAVKIGLQFGVLVKDEMEAEIEGLVVNLEDNMTYPFKMRTMDKKTDVIKSVDFGIPVGLSYEYKNIVLDARYFFGLSKIDNTADAENVHNRYFSVTLGYRLHL